MRQRRPHAEASGGWQITDADDAARRCHSICVKSPVLHIQFRSLQNLPDTIAGSKRARCAQQVGRNRLTLNCAAGSDRFAWSVEKPLHPRASSHRLRSRATSPIRCRRSSPTWQASGPLATRSGPCLPRCRRHCSAPNSTMIGSCHTMQHQLKRTFSCPEREDLQGILTSGNSNSTCSMPARGRCSRCRPIGSTRAGWRSLAAQPQRRPACRSTPCPRMRACRDNASSNPSMSANCLSTPFLFLWFSELRVLQLTAMQQDSNAINAWCTSCGLRSTAGRLASWEAAQLANRPPPRRRRPWAAPAPPRTAPAGAVMVPRHCSLMPRTTRKDSVASAVAPPTGPAALERVRSHFLGGERRRLHRKVPGSRPLEQRASPNRARPAKPPTTPPTIAPVSVEDSVSTLPLLCAATEPLQTFPSTSDDVDMMNKPTHGRHQGDGMRSMVLHQE